MFAADEGREYTHEDLFLHAGRARHPRYRHCQPQPGAGFKMRHAGGASTCRDGGRLGETDRIAAASYATGRNIGPPCGDPVLRKSVRPAAEAGLCGTAFPH